MSRLERLAAEGESFLGAATAIAARHRVAVLVARPCHPLPAVGVPHRRRAAAPRLALSGTVPASIGRSHGSGGLDVAHRRADGAGQRHRRRPARGATCSQGRRDTEAGRASCSRAARSWLTNVIVFSLVYWLFDRGGPGGASPCTPRAGTTQGVSVPAAHRRRRRARDIGSWCSSTTSTRRSRTRPVFSPTDVMPLTRWAKFAMMLESALSLMLAVLATGPVPLNILK